MTNDTELIEAIGSAYAAGFKAGQEHITPPIGYENLLTPTTEAIRYGYSIAAGRDLISERYAEFGAWLKERDAHVRDLKVAESSI